MNTHILKNNFETFKPDFKKDTGKDANQNIELYIQYYNARANDYAAQSLMFLVQDNSNHLSQLPDRIRASIYGMLRDAKMVPKP